MSDMAVQRWLERTVSDRGDVVSALVVMGVPDQPGAATHWPMNRPRDEELFTAAQAELAGRSAALAADGPGPHILTSPVRDQGRTVGAMAVRLLDRPSAIPFVAPSIDGLGAAAVLPPLPRAAAPPAKPLAGAAADGSEQLLQWVRGALAAPQFDQSAATLATELAGAFGCERVFVGMSSGRFVRLRALSHGAVVGQQQALARAVGAAMDEAVDQGVSIVCPQHPGEHPRITLSHAELAPPGSGLCVLTVPMFHAGQAIGALSFERRLSERFGTDLVQRIEAAAAVLAPLLLLKLDRERPAWQRLRATLHGALAGLDQRQRLGLTGGVLVGVGALALLLGSHWTQQITAPTRLEGQVQRAIVAPVDGFLKSALVRAGDSVKQGQLLAVLSDEDLRLERSRWASEVARYENSFAEAQAKADRTQLVGAAARVDESRAQLALVEQQLARTQMVAPFDALVIKGDLAQQLGAPVKRGDLLLTLTPTSEFRVMLEIDERDVGQIQPGARGAVTLSALPERSFALVVDRVMPVARVEGGRNLFEAEARLEPSAAAAVLRPGLQGVARLDAGERPLYWLLSHRVLDWLRLQWWSWVG